MSHYMPITGIDCPIPSLFTDTHAPVDALYENTDYRIRLATNFLGALVHLEAELGGPTLVQEIPPERAVLASRGFDSLSIV
jgi:hypothetical protein